MKISTLTLALLLALPAAAYAQDQDKAEQKELPEAAAKGQATAEAARAGGDRNPQTGKELKGVGKKEAKFKAGKALAETVKSKAPDPDYRDEDSDDDGLSDATESSHEATHTVQQKEGADATKRKRPGRVKYADVTLKKGAAEADDGAAEAEKPKKADKKKGDND